ncbi:BTAD domain-containing putative transcriptional regulator [Tranquillimonas rosea]|uniref:BTAD domain-containing putative transcriptional regulator n=1 Tax=Tranquillimonas rosea TaxID=641238 RepID=UPI003BA9AEA8
MDAPAITLLGAFGVTDGAGTPVRIETRKARALLAVLALADGRPVPRERLAGLLWSRGEMRQALASLSQALYSLRRALEPVVPGLLVTDGECVALDRSRLRIDVQAFERCAADGTEAALRRCLALYRGDLLDDLAIDTEEAYAEWRSSEAARLHDRAASAAAGLMELWKARPEAADAATIDRALRIDPYCEAAVRVRMRRLASAGRQAAALEQADRFARRLDDDLGTAPSTALTGLRDRIRSGDVRPPPRMGLRPVTRRSAWGLSAILTALVIAVAGWLLWPRAPAIPAEATRLLVRPFLAGPNVDPGFAEGFGDDLSTALVRRSGLTILSREAGRTVAEGNEGRMGASHVLHGRLRRDGDAMVLNAWIVATGDGQEVWAERLSGDGGDPRALRDLAVARVADRIGLALGPIHAPRPLDLPAAAVAPYLSALGQVRAGSPEATARAVAALVPLSQAHPGAAEPAAALALAYERIAFGADDFARVAGLHRLEGYLRLKVLLARGGVPHPDLLAVRARLALRRLDFDAAEAAARRALAIEGAHVAALETLARTQALRGDTGAAVATALRAIGLAPGASARGYEALALARFAEGDLRAARAATVSALDLARGPSLDMLTLAAAIEGHDEDRGRGQTAFSALASAVESLPFAAWRVGRVAYDNPRAATWRRPTPAEAAATLGFADPKARASLLAGLVRAGGGAGAPLSLPQPLSAEALRALLFGQEVVGETSWTVQQPWSQLRTKDGALVQTGAFGPLPAGGDGTSLVLDGRLCDSWVWSGAELETCQLVFPGAGAGRYVIRGEIGLFPFTVAQGARP